MATFKDNNGRDWSVRIDLGAIRRIKDQTGVNLAVLDSVFDSEIIQKLFLDQLFQGELLYAILQPGEKFSSIFALDNWLAEIDGTPMEQAGKALREALSDFIQRGQAQAGKALKKLLQDGETKIVESITKAVGQIEKSLSGETPINSQA